MSTETDMIIGIGSNTNAAANIALAHQLLRENFPEICFSSVQTTAPVGLKQNQHPFQNQLARLRTPLSTDHVRSLLKKIEQKAGRKATDKQLEIVKLDLDILKSGNETLKAEELNRPYYRSALKELF